MLDSSSSTSFFLLLFYSAVLAIWFFDFIIFATCFWSAKGVSNSLAMGAVWDELNKFVNSVNHKQAELHV